MSYRQRVYPDQAQEAVFDMHCAHARLVWNLALEQRNYWTRSMAARLPRLGPVEQQKSLAEARRADPEGLGAGSSSVQQAAVRDIHQAFVNWWKNPGHYSRPTWRSKHRDTPGFVIRDLTIKRVGGQRAVVTVPKVGKVRFSIGGRAWAELTTATSARVTQDRAGRWWVSLVAPQPEFERTQTGAVVGIDMGVAHTVTTSDGHHYDMADLLTPGERARKARLQRRLSRQTKGSKRRDRVKRSMAVIGCREADRRKNWIEQTTTALVRDHDLIAIEDLQVKNMVASARGTIASPGRQVRQKAGLNRSIHNQAWAQFRQRLEDKANAATSPVVVVAVNPANTSRRCSGCGHTTPENRENQAVFRCRACDHTANADVNAAINIRAAGLAVYGRGGDIRPGSHLPGSPTEASTSPPISTAPAAAA